MVFSVSPMQIIDDRPLQQLQKAVGQLTAAIEALVNDESLLSSCP